MDIVNSVRNLFPDVTVAVEQYRQAKPDREARNLARRLANEEALYDWFIRKLSLLSSATSMENRGDSLIRSVEKKFGPKTSHRLRSDLSQIEDVLRGLKYDLANASRGTEVLAKLRRTPKSSWDRLPKNPLQKRLGDLSRANKSLGIYLVDGQVPLPVVEGFQTALDFRLLLHLHGGQRASGFQITGERFVCACQEMTSRVVTLSDRQSSDDGADRQQNSGHISVSMQDLADSGDKTPFMQGADPTARENQDIEDNPRYSSAVPQDKDETTFRLTIKESNPSLAAMSLDDFISRHRFYFDRKKRMELAFRLSSAVLILWTFPWKFNFLRSRDWTVLFDPEQTDELCGLYLNPRSLSSHESIDRESYSTAGFLALSQDSVLTLLGLRLIELAFGRSFAQLRLRNIHLSQEEDGQDQELLNLLTARKLLNLRLIGEKFGQNFEDVVNVCINQQYRERKGACIKELNVQDPSFLERAATTILLPLYQEVRKNYGCICDATHPDEPEQSMVDSQDSLVDENRGQREHTSVLKFIPENFNTAIEGVNDKTQAIALDPPNPSDFVPGLSVADTSDDVISGNLSTHSQRATTASSGGAVHVPRKTTRDVHQPRNVSTSSQQLLSSELYAYAANTASGEREGNLPKEEPPKKKSRSETGVEDFRQDHRVKNSPLKFERLPQTRDNVREEEEGEDEDYNSVQSYQTMTVTTDSAFAWLSDHTGELSNMPENHPLMVFQGVAVRILLRAFHSLRERGSPSEEPARSTWRAESSKKRARTTHENTNDDEDEDEESPRRTAGAAGKKRRVKEEDPTFSCPFFKKDAAKHVKCCGYVLSRIRDVKQHLGRRHQMPIYCPRCIHIFSDEDSRDAHIRDTSCGQRPREKPEGITESQRQQLAKKTPGNQTPEQQWFGIFDVLFPGHEPRPKSPYINTGLMQNLLAYQTFMRSHGPRILQNILTARGAITWHLPPGEADMQAFQQNTLEEGIRAIFEEWTGSGGLAQSESSLANSSTRRSQGEPYQARAAGQRLPSASHGDDEDAEQDSVVTPSYYTATSSSHDSTGVSWDGQGDWLGEPHLTSSMGAELSFNPIAQADTEEIVGLWSTYMDLQNNNSSGYR